MRCLAALVFLLAALAVPASALAGEQTLVLRSQQIAVPGYGVSQGTFSHRFTRRGTYKLFCSLHPAQMVQEIVVR